jgi:hypothetical protein
MRLQGRSELAGDLSCHPGDETSDGRGGDPAQYGPVERYVSEPNGGR